MAEASNRTSPAAIRQGALPVQNIGAQMPLGKSFRAAGGGVYLLSMTKLLGKAVETMRGLPAEMQDNLARMLLQLGGKISLCFNSAPRKKPLSMNPFFRQSAVNLRRTNRCAPSGRNMACETALYPAGR